MASRKIARSDWQHYFERVDLELKKKVVEIEVAGLDLGDQIDVEWVPLLGVKYDPRDRVVRVFTSDHEHVIHDPKEVWVDEGIDGLHFMAIVDDERHLHLIRMREPLALPAPQD